MWDKSHKVLRLQAQAGRPLLSPQSLGGVRSGLNGSQGALFSPFYWVQYGKDQHMCSPKSLLRFTFRMS